MVVEFFVLVKVEVGDHAVKVLGLELPEPVFSLELTDLVFIYESDVCAVNAFERGVGLEFAHSAKNLTQPLNLYLLVGCVE